MNNQNPYIIPNVDGKIGLYCALWMIFGVISMAGFVIAFAMILSVFAGDEMSLIVAGLNIFLGIGFAYPAGRSIKKVGYLTSSKRYAEVLKKCSSPFISLEEFEKEVLMYRSSFNTRVNNPEANRYNVAYSPSYSNYDHINVKTITQALKYGYLRNCTLEFHDGKPFIAMHKKVVKDKCPHCGAPIVGVYDSTYICRYCGSRVDDVLEKK